MKRFKVGIVLLSVALVAALFSHVIIDILGDFLLVHDTYDDIDHGSRGIVAIVTLALACCGILVGLRAAIREAAGSEDAFCAALRSALPRKTRAFVAAAIVASMVLLCLMESCDTWLAGRDVDDLGDLFGGSVALGASVVCFFAAVVSIVGLACLRRLARARIVAGVIVAFLRRALTPGFEHIVEPSVEPRPIFRSRLLCRRIAGRAPPHSLLVGSP